MISSIRDKQNAVHYLWGSNCEAWTLADTPGLSVKLECMPKATKEQLHSHATAQQFFYILKGLATFYVNNEKITVSEQKGFLIQPGSKHFIANETSGTLEFLVISQPSVNHDRIHY